jgi:predicted phosphodiesterase
MTRRSALARLLWVALLLAGTIARFASAAAQQGPAPGADAPPGDTVRIFFISDLHSRHAPLVRFIDEANAERPDLVLDGGDRVHDGTESEFRRALGERERLEVPWFGVTGNHDAHVRGPSATPHPEEPAFRAVEAAGIRIILLDNHGEVLTEEQFQLLEAELREHQGRRILVVMHVPPMLSREPTFTRLRHALPYRLASPVMRDPAQVARFTALMERHRVLAVLAGHAHFTDYLFRGGVHYVIAGAGGGLTPGLAIPNEYLDLSIQGRELYMRRVPLREAPGNPLTLVARAFEFYVELNRFNHAAQGWNYVPSAGVQFKGGLRRLRTRGSEHVAMYGAASFERNLGEQGRQAFFSDVGLTSGPAVLTADLALGYKLRPVGDFNRNVYAGVAALATGGAQAREASAGVGARLVAGLEWRSLSAEVGHTYATDHRSTSLGLGGRF